MINDFTALDVETTGLNPKTDKLIEIGAVKIRDGRITERFHSYVYPGRRLEEKITDLTGITDEMLKDAPQIEEVLPKLFDFVGEDVLLGHRILFDYSFIKKAAVNCKMTFEKKGIDTLKIARRYLPQLESKKLTFLCEYFRIPIEAHRAESDAEAAARLYFQLAEQFGGEEGFAPMPLVYKVKKESPITKQQKERLYKLIEMHKIVVDYDIDKLTRNEASRITDKILATYGRGL